MVAAKKALKLPDVLVHLGRAVEVKGDNVHYQWAVKDSVDLYTNTKGMSLYCLRTTKRPTSKERFLSVIDQRQGQVDRAVSLYEDWHDFEPLTGSLASRPTGFLYRVDRVHAIVYESDKWTGKQAKYIHEFETKPILWVNSKTRPRVAILTGGKIHVRKAGITG